MSTAIQIYACAEILLYLSMGTTGFRSFTRSNPALFAALSIASYPCASVPGTQGRKQRVLYSRPRASRMLIHCGQGGIPKSKSPPWICYCLILVVSLVTQTILSIKREVVSRRCSRHIALLLSDIKQDNPPYYLVPYMAVA